MRGQPNFSGYGEIPRPPPTPLRTLYLGANSGVNQALGAGCNFAARNLELILERKNRKVPMKIQF